MEISISELNSKFDQFMVGGKKGFDFIQLDGLAEKIGTSEVALRFIIGLLAGFPFTLIYFLLSKSTSEIKNFFFTFTGLLVNYFCFGADFVYNFFSVFIAYVSLNILGATLNNVIFAFVFQTTFLTVGYIMNASDGYDVKWTTPQCILCMKLIGLAWDVYDGQQKEEELSATQQETCVKNKPSAMEIFGFSYCFCGFLAGPLFSFQRYIKFVNGTLFDKDAQNLILSRCLECIKRLAATGVVLYMFQIFDKDYRCDDLLKTSFLKQSFASKVLHMALVYYVQFSKYVIVWWLSESVCMFIGISYNGINDNGKPNWEGLRNFKMRQFLSGAFFQDIIESFNINTNQWAGRYLFRRLRFLNSKLLSHVITLTYLAIWHGFYIGYFIMFAMELASVTAERQYRSTFGKLFNVTFLDLSWYLRLPTQLFGALLKFFACGFFIQSFVLLRWRKIKVVYATVYYWPILLMGLWFIVIGPLLNLYIKSTKKRNEKTMKLE